uniref:DUF7894 domain-containing protein n=1 Tax=Nelumbo nucifera TaxID=4432 RepID=A0A822XXG4_NELNU|nr:TPA_asm: hypothetical protein HUJ06_025169 [Nelumbo nucifera]
MKTAPKIILLFRDADGVGSAIADALQPNHNSTLQRTYGIKDVKASGDAIHFIDHEGLYQVSLLLLQYYDPPIIACAVNELLASIMGENSSSMLTLILPFLVAASKLEKEMKSSIPGNHKVALSGVQIGPETDFTRAMIARIQKAPPSLQIHYEPLACLLQLVRVLKLPSFLLIGPTAQHQSKRTPDEDIEALYELGEFLASSVNLCFLRDRIHWNPTKKQRDNLEPWRALYG